MSRRREEPAQPQGLGSALIRFPLDKSRSREQSDVSSRIYGFDDLAAKAKHGDLAKVIYSANDPQNTPGLSYTYDRRGRVDTVTQAGGITTDLDYNDADQLTREEYLGGLLDGIAVLATRISTTTPTNGPKPLWPMAVIGAILMIRWDK